MVGKGGKDLRMVQSIYSWEDLFTVGEGAVLTLGFGLGVHLESTSWGSMTQVLEQGYLEVYINLSSHSFPATWSPLGGSPQ